MAGRLSGAMERALKYARAHPEVTLVAVAAKHEVDVRSLRRATRRAGEEPRPPMSPRGPRPRRASLG